MNGPLDVANSGPLCNAKYQVFKENGLSVEDPNAGILPWIAAARTSIASQVAAQNASGFSADANIVVSNNVALLTGQAPFDVKTITVNDAEYPLTWTTVTTWMVVVPLQTGTNQLHIVGVDRNGEPIAGDSADAAVLYGGTNTSAVGQVVINEIMYNPPVPGAEFIELFNASPGNQGFDLSQWQIPALSYTFPDGALILPGQSLVLAANRTAFAEAYGATHPVFDTFDGALLPPQFIALVEPGTNNSNETTVTALRYDNSPPWPTNVPGVNASMQLIDPQQDNWRVGNWAMAPGALQWNHVTVTGTASSSTLYMYLQSAGDVYLDDVKLVVGSVPEAGANVLADGDFESGFPGPWTVSPNLAGSVLSTAIRHSGNASLHLISTSAGTTRSSATWQTMSPGLTPNGTYTLSFWYRQSTNGGPLTLRLSGSGIVATVNPAPPPSTLLTRTPGEVNSVAEALTPFPPLWINEVQPENLTGITNRGGQRTSWLELYNPGTNVVSLKGLYLAAQYDNLLQWAFPASASVGPGEFKVIFGDGLTNLSGAGELHTSFALTNATGSLALTRLDNGELQVLDYLDYQNVRPDDSYGSFPDGQSFLRQEFYRGTPGAPNDNAGQPPPSLVTYPSPDWVYAQNFDSLPNPGAASVNTGNPVTINGVTYSLSNPYDFAGPIVSSGSSGGLGLDAMAGVVRHQRGTCPIRRHGRRPDHGRPGQLRFARQFQSRAGIARHEFHRRNGVRSSVRQWDRPHVESHHRPRDRRNLAAIQSAEDSAVLLRH